MRGQGAVGNGATTERTERTTDALPGTATAHRHERE